MVNMGELFSQPRIHDDLAERVPLTPSEADRFLLAEGDLLFARRSLTLDGAGKCSLVMACNEPRTWESSIIRVRPDPSLVSSEYLYYLFRSPQGRSRIETIVEQVAVAGIRSSDLANLRIPVPSLREQIAFADVLGTLDDKIESNRQVVRLLADVLAASWRSRFGAEASDWDVLPIGEVTAVVGCSTPRTSTDEYWGGEIAFATPKDLSNLSSVALFETARRITDLGLKQISSGLLPAGTVLLSSRAPIGYLAVSEVPVAVNQGFIALPPSGKLPGLYLWQWLWHNMDLIKERANGTTFLEVSKASFRPILISVPPFGLVTSWMDVATPAHRRLVAAEAESRAIADLRNSLLPKLLTGQVRVSEANDLVSGAV